MQWENLQAASQKTILNKGEKEELLLAQLITMKLISSHGNPNYYGRSDWEEIYSWVGVEIREELVQEDYSAVKIRKVHASQYLRRFAGFTGKVDAPIIRVAERLGEKLGLSDTEIDLVVLSWLGMRHSPLRGIFENTEIRDEGQASVLLGSLIGRPVRQISRALHAKGLLMRFELLEPSRHRQNLSDFVSMGDTLDSLSPVFFEESEDIEVLDRYFGELTLQLCPRAPSATLPIYNFDYIPQLQLIIDYLRRAIEERRQGANVLLYGAPGVGKTAVARALAKTLGSELFEVPVNDADQRPYEPFERLNRFRMAQRLLEERKNVLLLFDEIEDAFAGDKRVPKASTNQVLESNQIPALWLSNSVASLDAAFLRRFDLVIEVCSPHYEKGQLQIWKLLQPLPILDQAKKRLSRQTWMTPAMARQLTDLKNLLPRQEPIRNQQRLKAILRERLRVLGKRDIDLNHIFNADQPGSIRNSLMPSYKLEWLNTQPNLSSIVKRVKRRKGTRLCLYGPPGSGKTELANYLSKSLEKPLIKAHASTLLDMFVGGTETKIADLFENAQERDAVLLLDEADTFLFNRAQAMHSWEISHVNELLSQMERFEGIFIATTNRMESLDRAVMRRFDLKVSFHHLETRQLRDLLSEILPQRDQAALNALPDRALSAYSLTPGNMLTALNQLDLQGRPLRLGTLLKALESEQRAQQGEGSRFPIGFIDTLQLAPKVIEGHTARRKGP